MFQFIWEIIAVPLGFIMRWCYLLFNDVLRFPVAYIFALFLFALVTKLLLFPLSLKQQRSMATQQAYQPLLNEINQKYAKDPKKRQEELEKFQREYGYSPMAGCLPLLIQFPLIFGLVEVIYKPLTYMLRIPKDVLAVIAEKATQLAQAAGDTVVDRYIETKVIELIKTVPGEFSSLSAAGVNGADFGEYVSRIANLDMSIGQVNLWEIPKLELSWGLLIPIFSILSVVLSSVITAWATRGKTQDKTQRNTGRMMMGVSALTFAFMSFTLPAASSLYWGFSNVQSVAQSFLLRRIVNADTIRAEAEERIAEKRRQLKEAKKVKVKKKDGETEERELAAGELARFRLQRAREMDEHRYREGEQGEGDA